MTERGMFANGIGDELARVWLDDASRVLRVGRATNSHHKIAKGSLFIEFTKNGSFLGNGPLKQGDPAEIELAGRKVARVGLRVVAGDAAEPDRGSPTFELCLPEGVVWIELLHRQ